MLGVTLEGLASKLYRESHDTTRGKWEKLFQL